MEWNDKFHSILKETEWNLSKAKGKLASKVSSPRKKGGSPFLTVEDKASDSSRLRSEVLQEGKTLDGVLRPSFLDMNDSTNMHVMHMQEQIASQNRMIERLQRLVKTLDSEREFYKEEISVLKRDIDMLTNTLKNQSSDPFNSELKASNVKNEVMKEIHKVKAMVQNFERDSNKRSSLLSPRFDSEFWNIKENISDNLEQVRIELNQMKRRIDHMEDRLAQNSTTNPGSRHSNLYEMDHLITRPLYTPTNGAVPPTNGAFPRPTDSDLQLLKLSISSMNEKLENLERRNRLHLPPFQTKVSSSDHRNAIYSSVPKFSLYTSSGHMIEDDNLDVHSLSDLSDLSNLSDDGNIDDLDFDLMTLNLKDEDGELPMSSELRSDSSRKLKKTGKVDFDLSDLELSDFDDKEDINFDPNDLDLNF